MDLGIRPGDRPESFRIALGKEVAMEAGGKKWYLGKLLGWGSILNEEGSIEKVAIVQTIDAIILYDPSIIVSMD